MYNNILNSLETVINSNQAVATDKLVEAIYSSDNKVNFDVVNLADKNLTIFNTMANDKSSKSFLIVVGNVIDIDDAYINALMFIMDNKHFRAYTLGEIIDASSNGYRLISYKTVQDDIISGSFENNSILERGVKDVPDKIKDKVGLKVNGSKFSLSVKRSLFIFEKI